MKYSIRLSCVMALGLAAAQFAPAAAVTVQKEVSTTFRLGLAAAGEERAKLQAAVAVLDALLAQEQLWTNFRTVAAAHPKIYVGPSFSADGTGSPAEALALLRGTNSAYAMFPAQVMLTGTYYAKGDDYSGRCGNPSNQEVDCRATHFRQNYSNMLAVTHGIGIYDGDHREAVSVEIGREIFNRYNSTSATRRSCTFNTLAHEWTHTIARTRPAPEQQAHSSVVEDTGVTPTAGMPQLSYLFGSVAQCTWLQQQREVAPGANALKACVQRFAAVPFPSSLCV